MVMSRMAAILLRNTVDFQSRIAEIFWQGGFDVRIRQAQPHGEEARLRRLRTMLRIAGRTMGRKCCRPSFETRARERSSGSGSFSGFRFTFQTASIVITREMFNPET
jgi:hypothetical protein